MTIYLAAQIIGLLGFLIYISAPHFKTQNGIMRAEVLANSIIAGHWYLLDQIAMYIMSLLIIITLMIAIKAQYNEKFYKVMPALYPIGGLLIFASAQGTIIDILALASFFCVVASKSSQNIKDFRAFAAGAGAMSTTTGCIALSLPAIIFNFLFAAGHILKLWEERTAEEQTYSAIESA